VIPVNEPTRQDTFDDTIELWHDSSRGREFIRYTDPEVPTTLNKVFAWCNMDAANDDPIGYYSTMYVPLLKTRENPELSKQVRGARQFINYILDRYSKEYKAAINLRDEGLIDPNKAPYLFEPGQLYEYSQYGHNNLGILLCTAFHSSMFNPYPTPYSTFISSSFQRGIPRFGKLKKKSLRVTMGIDLLDVASSEGEDDDQPQPVLKDQNKGYWSEMLNTIRLPDHVMPVEDFPIKLATNEAIARFRKRGEDFLQLVSARSMANYDGHIYYPARFGPEPRGHRGRIIVDGSTCQKQNPHVAQGLQPITNEDKLRGVWTQSVEAAVCLYGVVPVFSLQHRQWGAVHVDKITPVVFRKDAIDRLVIAETKKRLLRALVLHHSMGFRDLVDNKNSSTIVLLAGPPGTGKSLTAQAVAESLERPLYVVNIDDIEGDDVEDTMNQIFELATVWNAVILIDEAEALMRKRENCDPYEARRVATFLRVVEAHEGIIFLTSNHAGSIDEAMRSRVSIVLDYQSAKRALRQTIWTNLSAAIQGGDKLNHARLAWWPLNGREIKHTLKISAMIAEEGKTGVTTEAIVKVLRDNYGPLPRMIITRALARLFKH